MPRPSPKFGFLSRLSLAAFILLLIAFFAYEPLKEWRLQRQFQIARDGIAKGQWSRVAEAITAARAIQPEHPELLRVIVTFLDATGNDPHFVLQALPQLKESGHAETNDAILFIRALLATKRFEEARRAFDALDATQHAHPAYLLISAQLLREEGDEKAATATTLKAHSARPEDPQAALALAIAESWNTPYEVQSAAIQRLWALAESSTPAAPSAIEHLCSQSYVTLPKAEHLLQLAEAHPLCSHATRLAVVSAIMRRAPERRNAMLDAEVARYRDCNVQTLHQVAFWLASESEHDRLLEICPMRVALQSAELFPVVALSLAQKQRWKELRRLLTEERVPAAPERVNVWLAWADGFLEPDMKNARLQLESAIAQAKKISSLEVLMSAVNVAEIHGMWDLALECYTLAAKTDPTQEIPLLEKACEVARHQNDGESIFRITKRLQALRPASAAYAERASYLGLILGEDLEIMPQARSASMQALLAALAAHRLQDHVTMKKEVARVTDATAFQAGERAVYAGLLALSGETAAGFHIAEKITDSLLLEQEKRYLKLAR